MLIPKFKLQSASQGVTSLFCILSCLLFTFPVFPMSLNYIINFARSELMCIRNLYGHISSHLISSMHLWKPQPQSSILLLLLLHFDKLKFMAKKIVINIGDWAVNHFSLAQYRWFKHTHSQLLKHSPESIQSRVHKNNFCLCINKIPHNIGNSIRIYIVLVQMVKFVSKPIKLMNDWKVSSPHFSILHQFTWDEQSGCIERSKTPIHFSIASKQMILLHCN